MLRVRVLESNLIFLDVHLTICAGCSHGFTFRKEGHTKIIEYELTSKQKNAHRAVSLKRPDVLLSQQVFGLTSLAADEASDSDVDMSDLENDGEPTYSDEEIDDNDSSAPTLGAQVPKAANGKVKGRRGRNERVMSPEECRAHLRRLFHNDAIMCSLLFGRHGPFAPLSRDGLCFASADMFFMEVIPVAPTRFRPPAKLGETLFEHPQNELLARILNTSYRLRDLNLDLRSASLKTAEFSEITRRSIFSKLLETLVQLQVDVNSFIDSSKNTAPMRQGKLPPAGVKQGLEKKEGLFRKNMMVSIHRSYYFSPSVRIFYRVNVSTMPHVLSFLLMSTSNRMRLASPQYSREN